MKYIERVSREVFDLKHTYVRGDTGDNVQRIQEWLCLRGQPVKIDGEFGPATQAALREFLHQDSVDNAAWRELIEPMTSATALIGLTHRTMNDAVVAKARAHLRQDPKEVGGQNRGPWVRLYMDGREGPSWPWCAGFVSFIFHQASADIAKENPLGQFFSCDLLAKHAIATHRFLDGPVNLAHGFKTISPGSIFLVQKSPGDWVHTGIVTAAFPEYFKTIEGNTNDSGDREGYEVCARTRGYKNIDFLIL